MENTTKIVYYPPDVIGWHCTICDESVDIWQKLEHIASPQHRTKAKSHLLGTLSDELSGQYIRGGPSTRDRSGSGAQENGAGNQKQVQQEEEEEYENGGYEETNDYDEYEGDWDDEKENEEENEEGDEEGDEEYNEEAIDGNRILWTCEVCNITTNIFARDDHLLSRPHIREARRKAGEPKIPSTQPSHIPMWRCTICDEEMTIFNKADHQAGKPHLKMVRKLLSENEAPPEASHTVVEPDQYQDDEFPTDELPESYTDLPDTAGASYEFTNNFYCITCAEEFDLSTKENHLDNSETWDCTLCSKTMHPVIQEQHLNSERHLMMMERSQAPLEDFYCDVCESTYSLVDKKDHLLGTEHQNMIARIEFEQRLYHSSDEDDGVKLPDSSPETLPHTTGNARAPPSNNPGYCPACKEPLHSILLSSHLMWHCTASAGSVPLPSSAPVTSGTFFCGICNKSFGLQGKTGHIKGKTHRRNASVQAEAHNTKAPKPKTRTKKKTPPEGSLYCAICNKYKMAAGMAAHKKSKKHKKKEAAKNLVKGPATERPATLTVPVTAAVPVTATGPATPARPATLTGPATTAGPATPVAQSELELRVQAVLAGLATPVVRPQPARPQPAVRVHTVNSSVTNAPYTTISGKYFHCSLCSRDRMVVGLEGHLNSEKHKKKLAVEQAKYPVAPIAPAGVIAQVSAQPTAIPATNPTLEPSSRAGKEYCTFCRKYKTPEAMAQHIKSKKHRNNVALAAAGKKNSTQQKISAQAQRSVAPTAL